MPLTECMVIAIAVIQFMTLCALISIAGSLHDVVVNGFTIHLDQLPRRECRSFIAWLVSVIAPDNSNNSSGKADPGLPAGEQTGEPDK